MNNYLRNKQINLFIFFLYLLFSHVALSGDHITVGTRNAVEHKNLELDLYLDLIRYNACEKTGILPYILKNQGGTYLEIGTGGDPIVNMLSLIPKNLQLKIIASDIESKILEALPARHPQLQPYLNNQRGTKIDLVQLDATDMTIFESDFFEGINASAVVHEIFSYAGGLDGVARFFQESCRVLKVGGTLVYRDPEAVANSKQLVSVDLKKKPMRLFAHIFIYKFLDSRGSCLAKSGYKVKSYSTNDISFRFYKKGAIVQSTLTYDEYIQTPFYEIDFTRSYSMNMPLGLCRELSRHYLTYLHQCNPLVFARIIPDVSGGEYIINYMAHSTRQILYEFFHNKGKFVDCDQIDFDKRICVSDEIEKKLQVLEFGIPIYFECPKKLSKMRALLEELGFVPSNHMIFIDNKTVLLDYRIFGLLYDELNKIIFDRINGVVSSEDEVHAKWLKREGEEFYFYLSFDELITMVLKITQTKVLDESRNQRTYVLFPQGASDSQFIERRCYSELLKESLEVFDSLGYNISVVDGKRIINFKKMELHEAIDCCRDLIKSCPGKYKNLNDYINSEL